MLKVDEEGRFCLEGQAPLSSPVIALHVFEVPQPVDIGNKHVVTTSNLPVVCNDSCKVLLSQQYRGLSISCKVLSHELGPSNKCLVQYAPPQNKSRGDAGVAENTVRCRPSQSPSLSQIFGAAQFA